MRLMSTLKWMNDLQLPGVGSWHLFGVTVGRPSLFLEVRGWGTPWPRALARGTVEGGGLPASGGLHPCPNLMK
jgi:hypothetical protein